MEMQKIELETARTELYNRQAKWAKAMEAISQALSSQMYPLDSHAFELIRDLLTAMGASANRISEPAQGEEDHPVHVQTRPASPEKIDTLTNTLLNWLERKRS
jgi:hypothetical protein